MGGIPVPAGGAGDAQERYAALPMRRALLLALLLGACGDPGGDGAPPEARPVRVRLWTSTSATLAETPAAPPREVFAARFEAAAEEIWTAPATLERIRDYVARTLKKA
jgi:hypothetical protein